MTLQHAVFAAEVPAAEATVTNNALCGIFAVLEPASNLLRGATSEWECQVECALLANRVVGQSIRWRAEMLSGVD